MSNAGFFELVARRFNEGDVEAWLELFSPEVEFVAGESWPETSTVHGREGLRGFLDEFVGVWEEVELRIDKLHEGESAAVGECHWVTRGRASGVEGTLEFVLALWMKDGLIAKGQFFDELPDALEAVGLDN